MCVCVCVCVCTCQHELYLGRQTNTMYMYATVKGTCRLLIILGNNIVLQRSSFTPEVLCPNLVVQLITLLLILLSAGVTTNSSIIFH